MRKFHTQKQRLVRCAAKATVLALMAGTLSAPLAYMAFSMQPEALRIPSPNGVYVNMAKDTIPAAFRASCGPIISGSLVDLARLRGAVSVASPSPKQPISRKAQAETRRTMIITAYTRKDKGMDGRGITASGEPVQEGVTIAAPPEIPFGSRVYIPALNHEYVVTDRGGDVKGDRLDLFMESRDRAMEFGKQRLEVVIIR